MKTQRRWSDFTPAQKAAIAVVGTVQVLLLIAALVDLRRRPAAQIRGNKKVWTLAAFINFVGPISYFLFGRNLKPAPPTLRAPTAPAASPFPSQSDRRAG